MNNIIIGVDLGGTKIMTGAIDAADGRVIGTPIKIATQSHLPKEQIVENIAQSIRQVMNANGLQKQDVVGVGVGSTGPLDLDLGLVLDCPQLPTMQHFALRDALQQAVDLPVALNNDANCLVLGEAVFGAARNKRTVLGFTLGTGIGCALVVDGKIWNGATGTAGEIWCSPHGKGIIEDVISGQGVANIYKQIAHTDASSLEVYQRAQQGERHALDAWETFGQHLAVPLAWCINLIDPDVILLGGSIATAHPFFMPAMMRNLHAHICPLPAQRTPIVMASLADNAGFVGAACLMRPSSNP